MPHDTEAQQEKPVHLQRNSLRIREGATLGEIAICVVESGGWPQGYDCLEVYDHVHVNIVGNNLPDHRSCRFFSAMLRNPDLKDKHWKYVCSYETYKNTLDKLGSRIYKNACADTNQATVPVFNQQVGGDHYKRFGNYQPWQVFGKWFTPEELRGYMKGTVIAYLARDKNGREDYEKAMHTLQLYLEVSKGQQK